MLAQRLALFLTGLTKDVHQLTSGIDLTDH